MLHNTGNIALQRLANQRISAAQLDTPEQVVEWLGAMQAQDYTQAMWAIGLRTKSCTITDVERAIAERKIIRTWPMRGTLHFVPARDVRWMLDLTATRMINADSRRQKMLGLTDIILSQCQHIFYDALKGGKQLNRPAMMQLLEDAGISTKNQRGYHILWYLAQIGLLCLGPLEGKLQTFVLLDEWVPDQRKLSHNEALALLAMRYFCSHAPASIQDFARWAGITLTDATKGFEAAKSHIAHTEPPQEGAYLLPGFDEFILGYKDRSPMLVAEHATKIVPGNNGVFLPSIVVNGQIVGTWRRIVKKQATEITLVPFIRIAGLDKKLAHSAARYSQFISQQITLKVQEIPV